MRATINGFITHEQSSWDKEPRIGFLMYDPRQFGADRAVIREHSFEVEVPDEFDPRPQQVEILRQQQQKIRAEMSARIKQLDDQINSLLAIEAAP